MYKNKKILALIPARGASKGLPYKNIRILMEKPLIAWTIEEAKKSKYLDRIIVSTEDVKIANISKRYGADVPFLRPKKLATDTAKMMDVVLHTMKCMEKDNAIYDLIILLQPTSPLRIARDIDNAIKLLFTKKAQAIVSICQTEHNPCGSNILPINGCLGTFLRPKFINKNRQELSTFYRINGAIYLAYSSYFKKIKQFLGKKTYAYIMPAERSVDIDTKLDFEFAWFLLECKAGKE